MIDDLRALAIFAETVRQKSFRAAAKELNLSPSVVSYHVAQLEKRVGTPLLYRTTRKLTLTHEGESLFAHASDMLDAARRGFDKICAGSTAPSGRISVMFPSVLIQSEFHRRLAAFCREYPGIDCHITYTDIRQDLVADGIDLAVHIGELEDSSLKSRRIGAIRRRMVCSPDCAARYSLPRHPKDLNDWEWIRLAMLPPRRRVFLGKESYDIRYAGHVTVDSVEAMTSFCLAGLGVATPPDYYVDDAIREKKLIELLPEWQVPALPLTAVWPGNPATHSNTRRLLERLAAP